MTTESLSASIPQKAMAATTLRQVLSALPKSAWTYVIFAALMLLTLIIAPSLVDGNALVSVLIFATILCLAALGLTITLILGGIDLSLPYTITFSAMTYLTLAGVVGEPLALVLTLLAAGVIGLINGIGITYLRIHPIVMTVATNGMLLGMIQLVFSVTMITSNPELLQLFTIEPVFVLGLRIPAIVFIGLAIIIATHLALNYTGWGRMVHLIGASADVARYAGIRVNGVQISVYAVAAVLNGLAGILIAGYFRQTALGMGDAYLLQAVSAVIVGGASIYGGRGSVVGTLGGALVLTHLTTMLTSIRIEVVWQQVLYGMMILVMALIYNRNAKVGS
jgi:ribose transport system permease protein